MPAPWGWEARLKGAAETDTTLPWAREEKGEAELTPHHHGREEKGKQK